MEKWRWEVNFNCNSNFNFHFRNFRIQSVKVYEIEGIGWWRRNIACFLGNASYRSVVLSRWHMSYKSVVLSRWHMCHTEVLSCPGDTCVIKKCCPVPVTHASYRKSQWHRCVTQKSVVLSPVTHVSYRSVVLSRWHRPHTEGPSDTDVSHRRVLSCPGDTCVIQNVSVTEMCHTEVLFCPGDTCVIQKVQVTRMCHTEKCCSFPVTHASYRKSKWHGCVTQKSVVLSRWHMRHTESPSDTDVSHRRVLSCPGDTCVTQKVQVTRMCHTEECCLVPVTHASYRKSKWHGCVT